MNDKLLGLGLYASGYFIQLLKRTFVDKKSGETHEKRYLVLSLGDMGVVNIGLSSEEYAKLDGAYAVGDTIVAPVEVFGYQNRAYLRLTGPVKGTVNQARLEDAV